MQHCCLISFYEILGKKENMLLVLFRVLDRLMHGKRSCLQMLMFGRYSFFKYYKWIGYIISYKNGICLVPLFFYKGISNVYYPPRQQGLALCLSACLIKNQRHSTTSSFDPWHGHLLHQGERYSGRYITCFIFVMIYEPVAALLLA